MATRTLAEVAAGTAAARPAAASTNANDLYFATDTLTLWRSTGSAWVRLTADPAYLANGANAFREPYDRHVGGSNLGALTSGQLLAVAVPCFAGDVITSIAFISGATALTMGSNVDGHLWFALYDPSLTLLSQSADQGGAATWAAGTTKDLALGAAQTLTATGIHYAAVMVNIGTGGAPAAPTLRGVGLNLNPVIDGPVSGQKRLAGTNGSGLTATAPTGPIAITASGNAAYCVLH